MTGKNFLLIAGGFGLGYWLGQRAKVCVTLKEPIDPKEPQQPQPTENKNLSVNIPPLYKSKICTQI